MAPIWQTQPKMALLLSLLAQQPVLPPEQGTPTDKPSRSPSGSSNAPTSPSGCISFFQQSYQTEGLSTHVASLVARAPHAKI